MTKDEAIAKFNTLSAQANDTELEKGSVLIGNVVISNVVEANNPGTPVESDRIIVIKTESDGTKKYVRYTIKEFLDALGSDVTATKEEIEQLKNEVDEAIESFGSKVTTDNSSWDAKVQEDLESLSNALASALAAIGDDDASGARGDAIEAIENASEEAVSDIGTAKTEAINAVETKETESVSAVSEAKEDALEAIGTDNNSGARGDAIDALEQKATELSVAPMLPYPSFHIKENDDGTAIIKISNDYAGLEGITMHYTTNGEVPTSESPVFPSEGLTVAWNCTVKVRAFPPSTITTVSPSVSNSAFVDELEATGPFIPVLEIQVGTAIDNCKIAITNYTQIDNLGGEVRYTVDGTDPDTSDSEADTEISVDDNITVKAKAYYPGGEASDASSITVSTLKAQTPVITVNYDSDYPSEEPEEEPESIGIENLLASAEYRPGEPDTTTMEDAKTKPIITGTSENIVYYLVNGVDDISSYISGYYGQTISAGGFFPPVDMTHKFYIAAEHDFNHEIVFANTIAAVFSVSRKTNKRSSIISSQIIGSIDEICAVYLFAIADTEDFTPLTEDEAMIYHPIIVDITANQQFFTDKGLTTDEQIQDYLDSVPYESFGTSDPVQKSSIENIVSDIIYTGSPDLFIQGETSITGTEASVGSFVDMSPDYNTEITISNGYYSASDSYEETVTPIVGNITDGTYYMVVGGFVGMCIFGSAVDKFKTHKWYFAFDYVGENPPEYMQFGFGSNGNLDGTVWYLFLKKGEGNRYSAILPPNEIYSRQILLAYTYGINSSLDSAVPAECDLNHPIVIDVTENMGVFTAESLSTDDEIRSYLDSIPYESFKSYIDGKILLPENLTQIVTRLETINGDEYNPEYTSDVDGFNNTHVDETGDLSVSDTISGFDSYTFYGDQITLSDYRSVLLFTMKIILSARAREAITSHKTYIRFLTNLKENFYILTGLNEDIDGAVPSYSALVMKRRGDHVSAMITTPVTVTDDSSTVQIQGISYILQNKTLTAPSSISDVLDAYESSAGGNIETERLQLFDMVLVDIDASKQALNLKGVTTDEEIFELLESMKYQDFGTPFAEAGGVIVNLASATAGADIHYTLDGSSPTKESSISTGYLSINPPVTVKAIAARGNLIVSDVATEDIEELEYCATPVITYTNSSKTVTIICETPNATIYYTTDGSSPSKESTVYTGPFIISDTVTVKAFAIASGYLNSVLKETLCEVITVFGVKWDYGNPSPALTRLTPQTDPLGLVTERISTEPVAANPENNYQGSSPFDNLYPYNQIRRRNFVDDGNGNFIPGAWEGETGFSTTDKDTMVYIPKFFIRVDDNSDNQTRIYYISNKQFDGFSLHPGSDQYVGAYPTSNNNESKSGKTRQNNKTIIEMRENSKTKGAGWGLIDIAERFAIQFLYLIEFSNWDSQTMIGLGANSDYATGQSDTIEYHTGHTSNNVVKYRNIEGLWSAHHEFTDGLKKVNNTVLISTDRNNYNNENSAIGYTSIGNLRISRVNIHRTIYNHDLQWLIGLSEKIENDEYYDSSCETYICDIGYMTIVSWNEGDPISFGYNWNVSVEAGLFAYFAIDNKTYTGIVYGSRLSYKEPEPIPAPSFYPENLITDDRFSGQTWFEDGSLSVFGTKQNIVIDMNPEVDFTNASDWNLGVALYTQLCASGMCEITNSIDITHKFYISVESDISKTLIALNYDENIIMKKTGTRNSCIVIFKDAKEATGFNLMFYFTYNVASEEEFTPLTAEEAIVGYPVLVDITANQDKFTELGLTTDEDIQTYLDGIAYDDFIAPQTT